MVSVKSRYSKLEYTVVLSQQKHPGSALSTLQLSTDSPGRRMSQRQAKSQRRVEPLQFLQPQHLDCQPQPTPRHHNPALDLGRPQQRNRNDHGLLLSGTRDTYQAAHRSSVITKQRGILTSCTVSRYATTTTPPIKRTMVRKL